MSDMIEKLARAGVREMHAGDLLNLDMLKEAIEVPFEGFLWGQSHGMMTPHVCEVSFGDGLHLLTISTIHQRPNYHVVRVDSGWKEGRIGWDYYRHDTISEHIDEICQEIEYECGSGRPFDEDHEDYDPEADAEGYGARDPWPAFDDRDGCAWGEIDWPWLMKAIGYTAMIDSLLTEKRESTPS